MATCANCGSGKLTEWPCPKCGSSPRCIHYSREPLPERLRPMPGTEPKGCYKPRGLWFSVKGEDDWPQWCIAENFHVEALRHQTEISFTPDARILHLKSAFDIRLFTEKYHCDDNVGLMRSCPDWPRVAKEYQCLIIAPYQWECRLANDTFWYYGWDCASGVVWDVDAIAELIPLDTGPR